MGRCSLYVVPIRLATRHARPDRLHPQLDRPGVITLLVVALLLATLVRERLRPGPAMLLAVAALVATGVLNPATAVAGFASPAVVTIGALSVVAGAVRASGALDTLVRRLLGDTGRQRSALARLLLPVAGLSSVLNNTPIVAAMAPVVDDWCRRREASASRYLMPLSYATILGGVITTVGTSTNLVVSGLLDDRGLGELSLFATTSIGLPVAIVGITLLVALSPVLLPDRVAGRATLLPLPDRAVADPVAATAPAHGVALPRKQPAEVPSTQAVMLPRRLPTALPPEQAVALLRKQETAPASEQAVALTRRQPTALPRKQPAALPPEQTAALPREHRAPLPPEQTTALPRKQPTAHPPEQATALPRKQPTALPKGHAVTRPPSRAGALRVKRVPRARATNAPSRQRVGTRRPAVALAVLVAFVGLTGTGATSVTVAATAAAVAVVALRCLTVRQLLRSVDLGVLAIVGASFALGSAIETTGLAARGAELLGGAASGGRLVAVLAVVGGTMLLTEPLSNAAAAALMVPVALDVAASTGGDPRVFAVAVAVAASASFMTPIGYQTNTMVHAIGGYRFGDFARLGTPLSVASLALVTLGVHAQAW